MGRLVYYIDVKHKSIVYSNLKIAFASQKTPRELRNISKQLFQNYGQNIIELLRLPLLRQDIFEQNVRIEGKEHVLAGLERKKGVILLAMHFGSWELGSLASAMMGVPYKMIVKPQKRFLRLDQLLNQYRSCSGSVVIERGLGMREFVKSLKKNEVVGMVVDQGGRDGVLVPFFERQASMSVGAIRMGLKMDVPICFSVIVREKGSQHRLVIHPPLELTRTGDLESDTETNLGKIVKKMEQYIKDYPAEYMWFYKIWKYSKQSVAVILHDGRTGHLRQSQTVARKLSEALAERKITLLTKVVLVQYQSDFAYRLMTALSMIVNSMFYQGHLGFMRYFLVQESYEKLMSNKADFIISCGSSTASVNYLLSKDQQAKSIVVLKPGVLAPKRFDLVILPQHDKMKKKESERNVLVTVGAPNLVNQQYLDDQSDRLLHRFSHLKSSKRFRIGLLIGGDTKDYPLSDQQIKLVIHQIKEFCREFRADILVTTSRRTSERVENLVVRELKKHPDCRLFILANRQNVPEAVGGILGLSDILVVSGDSISMISEAASSGKRTIVFPVDIPPHLGNGRHKHHRFVDMLNAQGFVLASNARNIKRSLYSLVKDKIYTRRIEDGPVILEALRTII